MALYRTKRRKLDFTRGEEQGSRGARLDRASRMHNLQPEKRPGKESLDQINPMLNASIDTFVMQVYHPTRLSCQPSPPSSSPPDLTGQLIVNGAHPQHFFLSLSSLSRISHPNVVRPSKQRPAALACKKKKRGPNRSNSPFYYYIRCNRNRVFFFFGTNKATMPMVVRSI